MPWSRRGGEALPVARTLQDAIAAGLLQPLDNAQVAHGAVAERAQRLPIGCAVMGGDGLLDARKFGNDDALAQARLVDHSGGAAREIAPAERSDRLRRELRVCGKLVGVGDRAIAGHPVCFRHGFRLSLTASDDRFYNLSLVLSCGKRAAASAATLRALRRAAKGTEAP